MSLLTYFYDELTKHLTRNSLESTKSSQKVVKFHEASENYDFSFPSTLKVWRNYLQNITEDEIEKYNDDIVFYSVGDSNISGVEQLRKVSSGWTFVIENVEIKDRHYNLTINRASAFKRLLSEVLENPHYGKSKKVEDETISIETENDQSGSITQLRVDLISSALHNLVPYSKFPESEPSIAKNKILVTSKSMLSPDHVQSDRKLLVCRSAMNPVDKKTSTVSAQEYISKRCQEMHLTSIHKYGVRMENNERFSSLVQRLGRDAATLDLLEVKHSSGVLLNPNTNQAFILYNSARMETLLEKFEKKVEEGYYQQLLSLNEVDTSLLIEHEEWRIAKLLLSFPELIDRSTNELAQGKVSVHLLHKFLQDLANIFSIYYRRVRLLTENRPQLMPVLHAKVQFLRATRKTFNITLGFFSISPIDFM